MLYDLIPITLYLGAVLWLGFRTRHKSGSQEEYLLSGRSLSTPAFVATLVTTWYGGILGIGEFSYSFGLSTWFVFGLPYYLFAFLFAFFLAPKIRRANTYSIPHMLYRSYGSRAGRAGSIFILLMTSPAPYILMLAVLIERISGLNFYLSLIGGTLFSVVYVWKGGFRSVVQTDKLQFLVMFSGFVILFYYLLTETFAPAELLQKLDTDHRSLDGGLPWQEILVWFFIASWTFVDPGFHQRCAAANSPATAKRGVLLSILFWFFFDLLTISAGLYAFILLPGIEPLMAYPELASNILPPFARGLFFTGLFAIIMSTIDSYTFLSALTFGRDIIHNTNNISDDKVTKAVRQGLIITALFAIGLVILFPSVIKLWYNLGSLFIPPLLVPLLAAYFPVIKITARQTFFVMIVSFLISFSLFVYGQTDGWGGQPSYPLGLEPFFPGLLFSLAAYLLLNFRSRRNK